VTTTMTDEQFKQWKEWYLSPPINYREVYGDAFVWTEQERQLMVLLKLSAQGGRDEKKSGRRGCTTLD
jgi:hypothetical protein